MDAMYGKKTKAANQGGTGSEDIRCHAVWFFPTTCSPHSKFSSDCQCQRWEDGINKIEQHHAHLGRSGEDAFHRDLGAFRVTDVKTRNAERRVTGRFPRDYCEDAEWIRLSKAGAIGRHRVMISGGWSPDHAHSSSHHLKRQEAVGPFRVCRRL